MKKKIQSRGRTPKVNRTDNPTAATVRKVTRAAKPKTAYDLLARVADHILEEPKRYYQTNWGLRGTHLEAIKKELRPACGTVACRAGWIVALHDGPERLNGTHLQLLKRIPARARMILGATDNKQDIRWDASDLFDGAACGMAAEGTVEHAKRGASGIRAFMRKHAAHLKSRLLKDVPKLANG